MESNNFKKIKHRPNSNTLYYSSEDEQTMHSNEANQSANSLLGQISYPMGNSSNQITFGEKPTSSLTSGVKLEDESWKNEGQEDEEDEDEQQIQSSPLCFDADDSIGNIPVKQRKDRKVRTTVTKERLQKMNKIFADYYERRQSGKEQNINLKEIARELNLGYSTILHKFRQFRANREVKGGALLESLQKKRKYKKSYEIEKLIDMSLKERSFATSVELSRFIYEKFGKNFSRSIISRHLATMGYSFNNIKYHSPVINDQQHIQIRKMYALMLERLSDTEKNFIYIDEFAFPRKLFVRHAGNFAWSVEDRISETEADYVSVLLSANRKKIYYYDVISGFAKKEHFCSALRHLRRYLDYQISFGRCKAEPILLTDIHKIHFDSPSSQNTDSRKTTPEKKNKKGQSSVTKIIEELNFKRYFLPPGSPQLNPLQTIFETMTNRLPKQETMSQKELRVKMDSLVKELVNEPTTVYFKDLLEWHYKALSGEYFDQR